MSSLEHDDDPHELPDADVPVVDLSAFDGSDGAGADRVAAELCDVCRDVGFVLISGHGVPDSLIDEFFAVSRSFFERPIEEKLLVKSPDDFLFQGYACPGDGPGYHTSERQSFNVFGYDTAADAIRDGYPADIGMVLFDALWPRSPESFASVWRRYFEEMERLAARLLRAFERGLGLADGWFDTSVLRHPSTLAANYYSNDIESGHGPSPYRFKAHRDSNVITILYQDDGPGSLQLHRRGVGWRNVVPVPGMFVVNLGELMPRWTNDRLRATPHRVLAPIDSSETRPRMSAPFFLKADLDAVIAPIPELLDRGEEPKYESITGREWLLKLQMGIDSGYDTVEEFADAAAADPTLR
jgi:isopenicillin N synthase-like dioxygenase